MTQAQAVKGGLNVQTLKQKRERDALGATPKPGFRPQPSLL